MATYYMPVACDIRAYGSVTVEADSADAALAKVDAQFVAENFQPHGSGSDDLDYNHPTDVFIEFVRNEETNEESTICHHVAPGEWDRGGLYFEAAKLLMHIATLDPDPDGDIILPGAASGEGNTVDAVHALAKKLGGQA